MILKTDNDEIINPLLETFKVKKDNNPFTKYLVYKKDDYVAILSYSVMYELIEINYIYVKEEYRKKGIATKLLQELIKENHDKENITLEVNENNQNAINLYKKLGFIEVAKRKQYYGSEDAILMIKKLGD